MNSDWVSNLACRLRHNNNALSHSFVMFGEFLTDL